MTKLDWDKAKPHTALEKPKKRKRKAVHPNSMAALKWKRKSWLQ
jgi:hypothetical protein